MKVELLPSTVGTPAARQFCIGAVVNDQVCIDAGTLGLLWPLERQQQVKHVLLSHTHIDHIASLPLFLDNVYQDGPDCPVVYGSPETLHSLQTDVFNGRLWPDFVQLSRQETPFLQLESLQPEVPQQIDGLSVLPVALNHIVPTLGFVVQDEDGTVAFVSDTGPCERIWQILARHRNLRAVFLEASFPNSHRWLAEKSGHLCPELFAEQLSQLAEDVPVIACHLKPGYFDTIAQELLALGRPGLEIGEPGRVYEF